MSPSEATEILKMYRDSNYDYNLGILCETYTDIPVIVYGCDIVYNIIENNGALNVDYTQDFVNDDGNMIQGYSLSDLQVIE